MKHFDQEYLEGLSTKAHMAYVLRQAVRDAKSKNKELSFTEKACKIGFICPRCNNGSGSKGQGHGITIYKSRQGLDKWLAHCTSCHTTWSAIQLQMELSHSDFVSTVNELSAVTGQQPEPAPSTPSTIPITSTPADFTSYYRACMDQLRATPAAMEYLRSRGIRMTTAIRFWLGFDPLSSPGCFPGRMGQPWMRTAVPRIIIPVSPAHYVGRATVLTEHKALNNKGAKISVFNRHCLEKATVCNVVEGPFDALSFVECGFNAVASCGKDQFHNVAQYVHHPLIFLLWPDNDPNPATRASGRKNLEDLAQVLRRKGCKAMLCEVPEQFKDVNEWYCCNRHWFEQEVKQMQDESMLEDWVKD